MNTTGRHFRSWHEAVMAVLSAQVRYEGAVSTGAKRKTYARCEFFAV
jgi:hypothetical protein